jgi:hypothetical protein
LLLARPIVQKSIPEFIPAEGDEESEREKTEQTRIKDEGMGPDGTRSLRITGFVDFKGGMT